MELTNILGRLKSEQDAPQPFLALELTNELVAAAVWHVENDSTQIVTLGSTVEWNNSDSEKANDNLIQAVDSSISVAVDGLPTEPNQAIFGIPSNWTTSQGIKKNKLSMIKLISRELELKPLGFVVILDSLLKYLKMQEGTPTTSLLIQVTHDEATINHVVFGKIEGSHSVVRSQDIAQDVEEGISQLNISGNLPSRIIVFDGRTDLAEIVQNLVSYDWQSKFQFVHLPKVESLPSDIIIRSIAVAGGAEVAKSKGIQITEPKPSSILPTEPSETPTNRHVDTPITPDFGFSDTPLSPPTDKTETPTNRHADTPITPPKPKKPKSSFRLPTFPRPKLRLPYFKPTSKLALIAIFLIFLASSALAASWFIPHAVVSISVEPKILEENLPLTLSTTADSIDLENSIVPATILSTTVSGTDSVNTTGTKTIGDAASGELTIYNRTDLVKKFAKGTSLEANDLTFTLDEDVSVASSSSGSDYVNVPGKATVKVTADAIGEDGNLSENTEFSVAEYSASTYIAKNESSLSGGNSSTISVVSSDDLNSLLSSISEKLAVKAQEDLLLSSTSGSGVFLLKDSFKVTDESYSADLGQEASVLEGTVEASINGIQYLTQDVEQLLSSRIQEALPPGYTRTLDPPSVELSSAEVETESEVIAEAKVKIRLLPQLNQDSIRATLRGLSTDLIKEALSGVVGMDTAHVVITPKFLPPRWKKMPRNPNNITIHITATN
jgi:hypothetical protein